MSDLQRAFSGKSVLVTGHTGFKGVWLSHWLHRLGARVHGMSLAPNTQPNLFSVSRLEDRLASHHLADIRDGDRVRDIVQGVQPEVVFHLAAQAIVREGYVDPVGTWSTNVMGTLQVLEAARGCSAVRATVVVTSDKCYDNREWTWGYRESDAMGGHDPYSASKGATELLAASYRRSYGADMNNAIATVRAGNVIGGGDWAANRIVPDCIRALATGQQIEVRSPNAVRPWQHVLEPLLGYLRVAEALLDDPTRHACAWNFGPNPQSTRTVADLVDALVLAWGGSWIDVSDGAVLHEARTLRLCSDKAFADLGWAPRWHFDRTVHETLEWYRAHRDRKDMQAMCDIQIEQFSSTKC